jgi:oligopeptidase B
MGRWFAITNLGAVDGRVLSSTGPAPLAEWEEHANEIAGCGVDGLRLTAHFLVLDEHYEGDSQLRVMPLGEGKQYVIKGSDLVGRGVRGITLLEFCEFDRDTIWFKTEGGGAPPIFWRYNLRSRKATKLARQRVGGGFNAKDYHTLREWARGDDGERIPISIFKRKDTPVDGSAPCMLEAYGAYGVAWDPSWSPSQLAMVNRGVVLAVAHVRGGGEKGASWWVSGKLENKENTFTDTVACAKHLLANGWAAKGRLAIRGGSAGGLTVGNALNAAPELFCAALLEAPFLDMATTMLNPALPLVREEYVEWGNPKDEKTYWRLRKLSPYDNVREVAYPAVAVVVCVGDTLVNYYEALKWTLRLRQRTTGVAPIVVKVYKVGGHSGRSGWYENYRVEADLLAFACNQMGISE